MSSLTTVSVVVAGFPAQLRQPKLLPGETLTQVAIRNNPERWKVCVENLTSTHGLSKEARARLLTGKLDDVTTPSMQSEVERFVNICLPTPFRTLNGLSRLRESARDGLFGYTLADILWVRESPPDGDDEAQAMAKKSKALAEQLKVTLIWSPTGSPLTLDLTRLLPHLQGEFAWVVPGGSALPAGDPFGRLERVIRYLTGSPRRAIYSDNIASYVVRTSCLHELADRGGSLPSDPASLGRLLQQSGYELTGDNDVERALCELEQEYGGWSRNTSHHQPASGVGRRPWWKRLFGG